MTQYSSRSVGDTEKIGQEIAKALHGGEVLALYGGLGMGKTALVRGICGGLGITDEVSSPTFSIVHEYKSGRLPVFHFDMYRISSWDDLESTAFFEYLERGGVVITEWSENIEGALPDTAVRITLSANGDTSRMITAE